MRQPLDVVALVSGLVLLLVALTALWLGTDPDEPWAALRVVLPSALVGIGVLGLVLSRR